MKISLFSLIFQGIPENIAIATLAFVLAKAPMEWKKIILCGISLGLTAFVIRQLPISFGVHTIVNIVLLISLINYFTKKRIKDIYFCLPFLLYYFSFG